MKTSGIKPLDIIRDSRYYRLDNLFYMLSLSMRQKPVLWCCQSYPITNHSFSLNIMNLILKLGDFILTYVLFPGEILTLEHIWRNPVLSSGKLPQWKFFIHRAGAKKKLGMSENRVVKTENLLLASNILVLHKGYNLQTVKSSVASVLSSDLNIKRKKIHYSVFHHSSSKGLCQTE